MRRTLVVALVIAQALDAATLALFYALPHPEGPAERNPIVLALMAVGGVQLVALVKVGVAAWAARRSGRLFANRPRLAPMLVCAAAVSGLVGACFNTAAIAAVIR